MADDGRRQDALRREEAAPEEHLPDVLDAERVLPDQQRLEMLDRADHGQLASGDPRLAHAIDALVGVHDHEQEIPMAAPNRISLDVGDLHDTAPFGQRSMLSVAYRASASSALSNGT